MIIVANILSTGSKLITDFFTSKSKGISGVKSSTASSSVSSVEEHALDEVYIVKICKLQDQLRNKDMVIEELKTLVTKRDVNRFVPDIAIKVVSLLDNPSDDCSILASILKNLVENQAKNVKHWNDATKSLFATI